MQARRKLIFATLAVGIVLAATALPGLAAKPQPEKIFKIDITPTSAPAGASATFTAKFTNITPGNSNFNSVQLTAPAGSTVSGVVVTGSNTNASAQVSIDGRVVTVTGLDPVKSNQFVQLAVTLTTPSATGCTGVTGSWTAEAWTGSNTSGNTFRLAQSSGLSTNFTVSCTLRFVQGGAPTGAVEDTAITGTDGGAVRVELLNGTSRDTSFSGSVSIVVVTPSGATLNGTTTTNAVNGVATFSNLSISSAGEYTLKATSGTLETAPVTIRIYEKGIACGEDDSASGGGTSVTIERPSVADETGDACEVRIPYSLDVSSDGRTVTLRKDDPTSQLEEARFIVEIAWVAEPASYPGTGRTTTFDLDFDGTADGTPGICEKVGGQTQYPTNPGPNGFYPAAGADFPWCVAGVSILPAEGGKQQVTETFWGSGDPAIER